MTKIMQTGLDRLVSEPAFLRLVYDVRIGLLAHPASVTRSMTHASEVLRAVGARPTVYFGPEHGFGGEAQDMIGVDDAKDPHGVPIRSLYGAHLSDLRPRDEDLDQVDLVVIDLQDVGSRYYTFVWTALFVARAAIARGKRVLVLDRPNPIGTGDAQIEGRLPIDPTFLSFVGLEPLPIRHGLTLGEILGHRASLEGFPRSSLLIAHVDEGAPDARDWDRPFVAPSPNMPSYETALVYPGGCLLEGTNLSEGRGTTRPFETLGAPWISGTKLADEVHALGLPGVRLRPIAFRPMFHKHAGAVCGGVFVHVTDPSTFRPVATYLGLVACARRQAPDKFQFRTDAYEFRDDVPAFDLLTGSPLARERIEQGSPEEVILLAHATSDERDLVQQARSQARVFMR